MSMLVVPHVVLGLKKKKLVWFENSDLFFQMEDPAWFVFDKLQMSNSLDEIAKEFSSFYALDIKESFAFVQDMFLRIEKMNQPLEYDETLERIKISVVDSSFDIFSVYTYKLGDKLIKFSYGSFWLEEYIHPLIMHLLTKEDEVPEKACFELFSYEDKVVFRIDGEVKGVWYNDESSYVKGAVFYQLINKLHNKLDEDWLMTVHASAITNGNKTILFSAAPGSGKTTMAALLQARGYSLISDDYVPFGKHCLNAYPFPIAMSIKEGSMELLSAHYPELTEKTAVYINSEKTVRYLPILNDKMGMVHPAQDFVFVNYNKDVDFDLEKLELTDAIKLCLDQIWVPPNKETVGMFFDRLKKLSFYRLTYSNNDKALDAITNLFEHD